MIAAGARAVALGLGVVCAGCRGPLPEDVESTRQVVEALAPLGSPVEKAEAALVKRGLRCEHAEAANFYDLREGATPHAQPCKDCLVCRASSSVAWMVSRRWNVGLQAKDGKVEWQFVTIDFVGP